MAGKGGGSWKVAYADFVTAMMAFFLVMWISAQDQSIKQAVANYFSRIDPIGASRKPGVSGSLFPASMGGTVPQEDAVAMGRGRNSYNAQGEPNRPTKMVSDWVHGNEKMYGYWREQATRSREAVERSDPNRSELSSIEDAAIERLANQLRSEFTRGIPGQATSLHQEMLFEVFLEVNWTELAEDLLGSQ